MKAETERRKKTTTKKRRETSVYTWPALWDPQTMSDSHISLFPVVILSGIKLNRLSPVGGQINHKNVPIFPLISETTFTSQWHHYIQMEISRCLVSFYRYVAEAVVFLNIC